MSDQLYTAILIVAGVAILAGCVGFVLALALLAHVTNKRTTPRR